MPGCGICPGLWEQLPAQCRAQRLTAPSNELRVGHHSQCWQRVAARSFVSSLCLQGTFGPMGGFGTSHASVSHCYPRTVTLIPAGKHLCGCRALRGAGGSWGALTGGMQGLSPNCSAAWGHTGTRGHGDTGTLGVWGQLGICHPQDTQRVTLRRNQSDPSSSDKSGGQQPASPRLLPTSMRKHIATTGATRVAAACPQGDRHHCRHQGPGSGIAAAISRAGCAVLDTASPWKPSRSGCAGSGDAISTETRGCAGRDARTVPGCCG